MARKVTVNIDISADASEVRDAQGEVTELRDRTIDTENTASSSFKGMGQAAAVGLGNIAANAISSAVSKLKQMASQAIQTGAKFEQSIADLEAITGLGEKKLGALGQAARENAVATGRSAEEQVKAYKLLASNIQGSAGRSVDSLKKMGKEVVTLAQASGENLETATNTVASTINQFNLEASESERVVNTLAAGAKEGAAEVGDLSRSLKNVGTTAEGADVSLEETTGAIEVLAQNGLKGAESGTQLRNVMTILQTESEKLAEHGIKDVNLESDGLTKTLEKLRPLLSDASARTEIFGRENQNAAQVLIENAESVGQMTEAVTDTATAQEQAAAQMDTFQGLTKKLNEALDNLKIALFEAFDEELKALIRESIEQIQAFKDEVVTFFRIIVETAGPALGVIEETFKTVFGDVGDILFNVVTSIPELFSNALDLAGENFQSFLDFLGQQVDLIKEQFTAVKNIIAGAFTLDREQFKKGLDQMVDVAAQSAESYVQLGKDLGSNYASAFKDQAEVIFEGVDTTPIQEQVDSFIESLNRAQQAGMGGTGGGQEEQQGKPARVEEIEQIEAAEQSLNETVKNASLQRANFTEEEAKAAKQALQQKQEAREAEKDVQEQALSQQIQATGQQVQSAEDAASAVVSSIKKQVMAKIANTIASAVSSLGPAAPVVGPAVGAAVWALFNNLLSGLIPGFREGGEVQGSGGPRDDEVLIRASDTEYVINAQSAQAAPELVRRINEAPRQAAALERAVSGEPAVIERENVVRSPSQAFRTSNTVERSRTVRRDRALEPPMIVEAGSGMGGARPIVDRRESVREGGERVERRQREEQTEVHAEQTDRHHREDRHKIVRGIERVGPREQVRPVPATVDDRGRHQAVIQRGGDSVLIREDMRRERLLEGADRELVREATRQGLTNREVVDRRRERTLRRFDSSIRVTDRTDQVRRDRSAERHQRHRTESRRRETVREGGERVEQERKQKGRVPEPSASDSAETPASSSEGRRVVVQAGPQPARPEASSADAPSASVEAAPVDTRHVVQRDRRVVTTEPATAEPRRQHRAPSQPAGADMGEMKTQLTALEAAVREQTERLEEVDRGVTIDPFHLGEELTKYDALSSSS